MDELVRRLKPGLIQLQDRSLNGEAAIAALGPAITPFQSFFVRCNGDLPLWDDAKRDHWPIAIDGLVERPIALDLGELESRFAVHDVTAVIECAGNGRALFDPPADGLQWQRGAVGCAIWTGVRLGDVLNAAGVDRSAVYVAFESLDRQLGSPDSLAFSRGLPLAKALADETLLAFAMNGEALHGLHGGPLRIVAPGFPGAAWQKWVSRIFVRDREHDGPKMTGLDYRIDGKVIEDMPVKSLITAPLEGFVASSQNAVEVSGFAWSGHLPVASVAISGDGGQSWTDAVLEPSVQPFAWRRFRGRVLPPAGKSMQIVARATDVEGHSQPLGNAAWNPKGYCNNTVHRVNGEIT